tara:strand:+ start:4211 stop:5398 length:1188 start_codon:yes stop_codon:yes gene_type:complete
MADKKFSFSKLNFHVSKNWNWKEDKKDQKFVKYGDNNKFPQELIELYNRSSIHGACINAIVEGVIGKGLTANEDHYIERANPKESWNDIFEKVSLDQKLFGSFALEIIYSNDRSHIDVYHVDYSTVRAVEKDRHGHIHGYYLSNEWDESFRYLKQLDENVIYLPAYNTERKAEEAHQLFVVNNYRPGQEYYALPDYIAALRVIELDVEVDNFHTNNIKNGLAPSLSITTFTGGSDDQLKSIEEQLNSNYGGSNNAGSLMYIDVDSPENAPQIVPIPQNGADGYYTTINDTVLQKILTAHRITSPMILGIKTEGQLGGRAEVIDSYLLFQNIVLEPLQQDIVGNLEGILRFNYPDAILGVEQKKLYDDGDEEVEVITDTDTTVEEQVEIEEPEILA